jgi:MFS superfamily sulfate permease-like transporter
VGPVAGLYALLLPAVAYTLFGSSRQLIVGPDGSIAALTAAALIPLAAGDPGRYGSLAALLAVLVGAWFLVVRKLPGLHTTTLAVGGLCLAALLLLRWRAPQTARGAAGGRGRDHRLGRVRAGLGGSGHGRSDPLGAARPCAAHGPLGDLLALVPAALGIFFVSFSDEILTARSFAGHHGQHVAADTELTAMAAASLAAGIT